MECPNCGKSCGVSGCDVCGHGDEPCPLCELPTHLPGKLAAPDEVCCCNRCCTCGDSIEGDEDSCDVCQQEAREEMKAREEEREARMEDAFDAEREER